MPRLPAHLIPKRGSTEDRRKIKILLRAAGLHTVCESARCPNIGECFSRGTATFLILGDRCTRGCSFCAIDKGAPLPPDPLEPDNAAAAAKSMGIRHAVITSVTRDDLLDGGATQFAKTIRAMRDAIPDVTVETLIPDFGGRASSLAIVFDAAPDVLNHNIETVPRLYPEVRAGADYDRSLKVISSAKSAGLTTKSGLMLGLGEERSEVVAAMRDLAESGCDALTIGQYLQPTRANRAVTRYLAPEEFADLEREARAIGFLHVAAGPLVRSSYMAEGFIPNNPHWNGAT